jgi:hypothetical protein
MPHVRQALDWLAEAGDPMRLNQHAWPIGQCVCTGVSFLLAICDSPCPCRFMQLYTEEDAAGTRHTAQHSRPHKRM